jgi:hypothetical protein
MNVGINGLDVVDVVVDVVGVNDDDEAILK